MSSGVVVPVLQIEKLWLSDVESLSPETESYWESSDCDAVSRLPVVICVAIEKENNNTERDVKMQSHFQMSATRTGLHFLKHLVSNPS